jgi:putative hydrolase of the HAD superfamily
VDVLLLDLDETLYPRGNGVLARTDACITAWVAARLGLPHEEAARLRVELWRAHGTTLRGLVVRYGVEPEDYLERVYRSDLSDLLRPDPALRALLERLPGRKAVLTNAPRHHARSVIELLAIGDAFEDVIALEDLALVPKPAPEAYARALARMGVAAERCTFVDDTLANAAAGAAAGLRSVWLAPPGSRAAPPAAAAGLPIIEALAELEPLLAEWSARQGSMGT